MTATETIRAPSQGVLFPDSPPPFGARCTGDGEGWRWCCPHCGGSVYGRDETLESITTDPACALCRAEFRGLPFLEWRKLPQPDKEQLRPPDGWRSRVDRSIP